MNQRSFATFVLLGFGWLGAGPVWADQAADEAAIRNAAKTYAAAFNKGDAKALAAHWLPDAVYLDTETGTKFVGRAAIEKHFADLFKEITNAKLTVEVESVKFVSPHCAVEQGTAVFVGASKEPTKTRYNAVHIQRDGKWLMDRVSDEEHPSAVVSHYDQLKELEWMVGTWVDTGKDGAVAETHCKWAKNKNFLVRTFSISVKDRISTSGVQIVGWDPTAKQIRSWVFDSNGGFGEGKWTKNGKSWHIQIQDTLTNGQKASSMSVVTYIDQNSFTWESLDRQAAGRLLPSVGPVTAVRKTVAE